VGGGGTFGFGLARERGDEEQVTVDGAGELGVAHKVKEEAQVRLLALSLDVLLGALELPQLVPEDVERVVVDDERLVVELQLGLQRVQLLDLKDIVLRRQDQLPQLVCPYATSHTPHTKPVESSHASPHTRTRTTAHTHMTHALPHTTYHS
jgi:hypothetical protein